MTKIAIFFAFLFGFTSLWSQEFKVEYAKDRDFSQYKTFRFGEGELVTPKDQRQASADQVDQWIKDAITEELTLKGLKRVDSLSDLVISYVVGTQSKSDAGDVGPMGLTPGSMQRTYMKDYLQGNIVIDMNDRHNIKVWRVNATMEMSASNGEKIIGQVVQKGFRKFPKSKEKRKKK